MSLRSTISIRILDVRLRRWIHAPKDTKACSSANMISYFTDVSVALRHLLVNRNSKMKDSINYYKIVLRTRNIWNKGTREDEWNRVRKKEYVCDEETKKKITYGWNIKEICLKTKKKHICIFHVLNYMINFIFGILLSIESIDSKVCGCIASSGASIVVHSRFIIWKFLTQCFSRIIIWKSHIR